MTESEALEKARELHGWGANEAHTKLTADALIEAFNAGVRHRCVPRGMVSVHGTYGCSNCETGRITLYAGSRICVGCQHRADSVADTEGKQDGK